MTTLSSTHVEARPVHESNYIRQYSLAGMIRSALQIYLRHFKAILLCYLLPMLPLMTVQMYVDSTQPLGTLQITSLAVNTVMSFFVTGAMAYLISDICLGNAPEVVRSYARLFRDGLWLKLLAATLLALVVMAVGFVLLIIPGLIAIIYLILVSQVVVLERVGPVSALKRSKSLIQGSFWRTVGTLAFMALLMYGLMFLVLMLLGFTIGFIDMSSPNSSAESMETWLAAVVGAVSIGAIYPFFFIMMVLIYYDRRSRKESYDVVRLEEDMMR